MIFTKKTAFITTLLLASNILKLYNTDKSSLVKKDGNMLNLPSFKNAIEIKSSVDGRIRFNIPILKSNIGLSEHLVGQIKNISVISLCKVNTLTGSVLVEYDNTKVDAQTIEGAIIKLLGIDKKLDEGRESEVRKKIDETVSALNNGIYDYTNGILDMKTLVGMILLLAALRDLRLFGPRNNPGYPTLFWWSSTLFL